MANLQKIKEIAKEQGISLSYIAERIGMTPNGLSIVMKNNKTMTDKLEMIAHILHVKVGVFFDEETCDTTNQPVVEAIEHYRELLVQKDKIIEQKDAIIEILKCRRK